jgi:hypothetical protein
MPKTKSPELNGNQTREDKRQALGHLAVRAVLYFSVTVILAACGGGSSSPIENAPAKLLSDLVVKDKGIHDYYVSNTGSDDAPGTRDEPFQTIQHAANAAMPGTTIHVAPGTYAENIITAVNGLSARRIVYSSDEKGGAKIVPPPDSPTSTLWLAQGDHTDIIGFDFSAAGSAVVLTGLEITGAYSSARNNHVHHIGNLPLVCGSNTGAGIRSLSDPAVDGHTDVVANEVHDIGQGPSCTIHGIYLGTSGTIKNNLVYNIGWGAIYLWRDIRNADIANNTVLGSLYGIIYGNGNRVYDRGPPDYINVSSNIVYDNVVGIRNAGLGTLGEHNTMTNNLVFSNSTNWYTSTPHEGDIAADPQFVKYTRTGGADYRLQSTSPAIDRGATAFAPATDFDGTARPFGAGPDIGAFEFSAPPEPTTTYHLYVDANKGSDSNPGTEKDPFLTIQRAADVVKPDTTVHVAPGIYKRNVTTTAQGTASARIRYVSDVKGAAVIVGNGTEAMWTNRGDYTDIVGFDISGTGRLGILNWASHTLISGNHVHDLTVSGGCTTNGGAGINNANYKGSDGDIIGNVVHDIGVPATCNGIQGIYTTNLRGRIYNNIVYRASAFGIHLWHAATDVIIANNTVFANGGVTSNGNIMGAGIEIGNGDSPGGVIVNNTKVINNISYDHAGYGIVEYCYKGQNCIGPNNTYANNLVYRNGGGISLRVGSATGTVIADPKFVNYQANGTGKYDLQKDSPAVDKGLSSADAPAADINNVARPRGAAPDIGAHESH